MINPKTKIDFINRRETFDKLHKNLLDYYYLNQNKPVKRLFYIVKIRQLEKNINHLLKVMRLY